MRRLLLAILFAAAALKSSAQTATPAGKGEESHIGVIPVVANTIGVGEVNWRSEVALQNNSAADAEVLISMPGAKTGAVFIYTTMAPGQALMFGDIVGETFGLDSAMGPLVIQTFGSKPVAVSSVIRAFTPHGEAAPQVIPRLAQSASGPTQALRDLQVTESHRTNVGLANLGDEEIHFSLGLQVVDGRFVETVSYSVPPYTTLQQPLQAVFPVLARGSDLTVVVEISGRNGFAYASVIDNESSNARFITPSAAGER